MLLLSSFALATNGLRLAKGGTFTTKLDLKNQCLTTQKTVFGTRNLAF